MHTEQRGPALLLFCRLLQCLRPPELHPWGHTYLQSCRPRAPHELVAALVLVYAMISSLLFSVLITLVALSTFAEDKLIFYREASAGCSVSAFFFAEAALDIVEHMPQAIFAAVVGYCMRASNVAFGSWALLHVCAAWVSIGWSYIFALTVPQNNLVMVAGLLTAMFGSLLSGALPFFTVRPCGVRLCACACACGGVLVRFCHLVPLWVDGKTACAV